MRPAREVLAEVYDPELPVLTLADLGVLRDVVEDGDRVEVVLTPTYSGCPAMEAMHADVRAALERAGYRDVHVRTVLSPAWSTDWISDEGRRKLAEHGIAPPARRDALLQIAVRCPQCGSTDTELTSRFGSTACTSLRRCRSCREPFPHVRPL